jgi:hypothetical protein
MVRGIILSCVMGLVASIATPQVATNNSPGTGGPSGPVGSVRVVDSRGQEVGALVMAMTPIDVPIEAALRNINGTPTALPVSPRGFAAPCCDIPYLYLGVYETTDCTGTRYVDAWNHLLVPLPALIENNRITYPSGTIQSVAVRSKLEWSNAGAKPSTYCRQVSYVTSAKEVLSIDLASLGLVPPFSVR